MRSSQVEKKAAAWDSDQVEAVGRVGAGVHTGRRRPGDRLAPARRRGCPGRSSAPLAAPALQEATPSRERSEEGGCPGRRRGGLGGGGGSRGGGGVGSGLGRGRIAPGGGLGRRAGLGVR